MAPRLRFWLAVKCMILATIIYVTIVAKYASYQSDTRQQQTNHHCQHLNQSLHGATDIDLEVATPDAEALESLAKKLSVTPGGSWTSPQCPGGQRVAVIVPYRDRWRHLSLLLTHLHPFLQRQHATYTLFVVEQAYNETFNKGLIMNTAFAEVMKQAAGDWDCVIFHDVDMVPQNDRNLYGCGNQPRHLSPALDNMRYMLMYPNLVGGVLALTPQQMVGVNGYSNLYWGWGAEDDDMSLRILNSGYNIERPPSHVGRYKMASHPKREMAENRVQLLAEWGRFKNDGINSLHSFQVKVLSTKKHPLYTNITVDIGSKPASIQALTTSNWAWLTDWLLLWKLNI